MRHDRFVSVFIEHLSTREIDHLQYDGRTEYTETAALSSDPPSRALAVIVEVEPGSSVDDSKIAGFAVMTASRKLRDLRQKIGYQIADIDWTPRDMNISAGMLAASLDGTQYSHLRKGLERVGGLPRRTGENLVIALREIDSGVDPTISRVLRSRELGDIAAEELTQRAEERDAVATAFEIVGLDRVLLRNVDVERGTPFLTSAGQQLQEKYAADERSLLRIEMTNFDGLPAVAGPTANSVVFTHPEIGHLTVVNIDTSAAETAAGVDLIYYRHETKSFVLVQYKRMHKVGHDWKYTEDKHLRKQLAALKRLETFDNSLGDRKADAINPWDFRLVPAPGYFKFIRSTDYVPYDHDLMPGMYVPTRLLELLLRQEQYTSTNGKLSIGFDTSSRRTRETTFQPPYLSNTEFMTLLRGGWSGSTGTTTDKIMEIIKNHAREGRALVAALHRGGAALVRPRWRRPAGRR